jgi:hypothetical protein
MIKSYAENNQWTKVFRNLRAVAAYYKIPVSSNLIQPLPISVNSDINNLMEILNVNYAMIIFYSKYQDSLREILNHVVVMQCHLIYRLLQILIQEEYLYFIGGKQSKYIGGVAFEELSLGSTANQSMFLNNITYLWTMIKDINEVQQVSVAIDQVKLNSVKLGSLLNAFLMDRTFHAFENIHETLKTSGLIEKSFKHPKNYYDTSLKESCWSITIDNGKTQKVCFTKSLSH